MPLSRFFHEPVTLGRLVPLRRTPEGLPIIVAMPRRIEAMEYVANELFTTLGQLSVSDLKRIHPSPAYKPLIDALLDVRIVMGGEGS